MRSRKASQFINELINFSNEIVELKFNYVLYSQPQSHFVAMTFIVDLFCYLTWLTRKLTIDFVQQCLIVLFIAAQKRLSVFFFTAKFTQYLTQIKHSLFYKRLMELQTISVPPQCHDNNVKIWKWDRPKLINIVQWTAFAAQDVKLQNYRSHKPFKNDVHKVEWATTLKELLTEILIEKDHWFDVFFVQIDR